MTNPYITTENTEKSGLHRGSIKIRNERLSGHLILADILICNGDGEEICLHRIDLGKLKWLIFKAEEEARANE